MNTCPQRGNRPKTIRSSEVKIREALKEQLHRTFPAGIYALELQDAEKFRVAEECHIPARIPKD